MLQYNSGFHLENLIRGGSSAIIMKGGHDQMKSRCGSMKILVGGQASPHPPVDETLQLLWDGL